ncbi:MAG: type II toxin-antitoxin system HicA family toxin [Deltaproteobacteria bacterium]|nr:type II toxin-antitoxin system HicA family toxin [Deltaproteobacteria bacterium]
MRIIHTTDGAELLRILVTAGWELHRIKGSHHVYIHPETGAHISIPHPKKDLGPGLVHKILKQAGLK